MIKYFLILIVLVNIQTLSAQETSANLPTSSAGIGKINEENTTRMVAIGGSNAAIADSTSLNFSNPASYSYIAPGQPIFSVSVTGRISKFQDQSGIANFKSTTIDHFAFGISFGKRFGVGLGLKPFLQKAYRITTTQKVFDSELYYVYKGSGRINNYFLGASYKLLDYKGFRASLGAQFNYFSGTTLDTRSSYLDSLATSKGESLLAKRTKGVSSTLGFLVSKKFNSHEIQFGLAFSPSQKLDTWFTDSTENNLGSGQIQINKTGAKGYSLLPSNTKFGLVYTYEPKIDSFFTNKLQYKLSFFANYETSNWSQYREVFGQVTKQYNLLNSSKIGFGVELTPHRFFINRTQNISYLAKISYRAGFEKLNTFSQVNNNQLSDARFSIGFGFPLTAQRSTTSLQFGIGRGIYGTKDANSIRENYNTIHFGIILAPGINDRWFRKYKFD